nr:DUF6089 family protein [Hoylesella enoeca]
MQRLLVFMLFFAAVTIASAQDDMEYRWEAGAAIGTVAYDGDFNGNILRGMQPAGVLLLRRILNPYMALKFGVSYGRLKGSSANVKTFYPTYRRQSYRFDNALTDIGIAYEYNFWPYGTGRDYRGAKRLTPFVMVGIGGTYVTGDGKHVFTAQIPLGLGVKYKWGERLNIALEWAMHFSLSDELDGVKDPYGVKSSGIFKNTDGYSTLTVGLTYNFAPKCRTCNKDF